MSTAAVFNELMDIRGLGAPAPGDVMLEAGDRVWPTRFRIEETLTAVLGGVGVALSDIWQLRTGRRQTVHIAERHAAAALKSAYLMKHPDETGVFREVVNVAHNQMRQMAQPWPTRDGRWFLPHFGLPHLRQRVLDALQCEATPEGVARAVAGRDGLELEAAIDTARACGGMVRSAAEWRAHPHGCLLANRPVVEIVKIGDAPARPLAEAERPLSGIRVLDMAHILAGPMAARTLAEHGADVINIGAEHLPSIQEHVTDTGHGKRSCFLNLKTPDGIGNLHALLDGADVLSQSYRVGALDGLGLSPEVAAARRPGIVYVSISCYGIGGPFSHRGGWEQLGQVMSGICHDNGTGRPTLLPVPACDYTTGYLASYGTLLALARRAKEGGSWHVRVSLCQSGMLIHRQGQFAEDTPIRPFEAEEVDALSMVSDTHASKLKHLAPVLRMSDTPGRWDRPTPKPGSAAPVWL